MGLSKIVEMAALGLTVLLCGVVPVPARGEGQPPGEASAVFYVETTGNDSNPGTEAQPWRTIQKAAETLVAGETVLIRGGTYRERVTPLNSGTEGSPITFSAYPGEAVVLDGLIVVIPEWGGLFDMTGLSHITVQGIRVMNAGPNPHNTGILADGSHHITVRDCSTSRTNDSGIGVWGSHDVIVEGCEVEQACLAEFNEAISFGGTYDFEVRGCNVHDIAKEGICLKDGSYRGKAHGNHVHHNAKANIYVDAWDKHTHDLEVYGNVLHDSAHNGIAIASEQGGLLENIRVFNNVAYDNTWCGIHMTTCCIDSHPVSGVQIVNNTVYNNGREPWGGGILIENPQATGVVVRNNICSQNLTFQIAVPSTVTATVDHNLIDGFREDPDEIRGDDFVEGDPLFLDPAAKDYHLKPGSPAFGAGSAEGAPADDFDGYHRGNPPDIGAFEHHVCAVECSATAAPGSGTAPLVVSFSATATTSDCTAPATFAWAFGDGVTSALQAPIHTYAQPGTYAWTLVASADGKPCSRTGSVLVEEPCSLTCEATATPSGGPAPLVVAFASEVIAAHCAGSPTFAWTFGDGAISQEQSPSHTYATGGTYPWTLVATLDGLNCTRQGTVEVVDSCTLTCEATASPASGSTPLQVAFLATIEAENCPGEPAFLWEFGDGGGSQEQNPSHTYAEVGVYTWSLTVSLAQQTCARGGTVTVIDPCTLLCAAAVPSSGRSRTPLTFSATALGQNCAGDPAFAWEFGDGQTGSGAEVTHAYDSAGTYVWSLRVLADGATCERGGILSVQPKVPGDADDDGTVSIGEVQQAVNMFLGIQPPGNGADCNGDGAISIGEVQKVINAFLGLADSC